MTHHQWDKYHDDWLIINTFMLAYKFISYQAIDNNIGGSLNQK